MPRIHLSIDTELFDKVKTDADKHHCTVNVFLITMLEKIYKETPFDYEAALIILEQEAQNQPAGAEFALCELSSFEEISVGRAADAKLKPSTVRARLGKMFNTRVGNGAVPGIIRSADENGNLKFRLRAALYKKLD